MSASAAADRPQALSRLRVDPDDPIFLDGVFADLLRISRSAVGRSLLDRLKLGSYTVTICKPVPAPDPPNAWTEPTRDRKGAGALLVVYDPADWPCAAYPTALPSDVVLFGRLLEAASPGAVAMRDYDQYLHERLDLMDDEG